MDRERYFQGASATFRIRTKINFPSGIYCAAREPLAMLGSLRQPWSALSPLVTLKVHEALCSALGAHALSIRCSLDLERSTTTVEVGSAGWTWQGRKYPWLQQCKDKT